MSFVHFFSFFFPVESNCLLGEEDNMNKMLFFKGKERSNSRETVEKKESFIPFVFLHDSEVRKQKLCPMQPEIKGSRQETWCQKKRKRNGWSLGYKKKVSSWDEFQARKLSLKRLQKDYRKTTESETRQEKREEYKSRCNCKKCILETKKTPEDSSLRGRCRDRHTT